LWQIERIANLGRSRGKAPDASPITTLIDHSSSRGLTPRVLIPKKTFARKIQNLPMLFFRTWSLIGPVQNMEISDYLKVLNFSKKIWGVSLS
jgi:hypothetical protein